MSRTVRIALPLLPTPAHDALVALNVAVFLLWQVSAARGPEAVAWMERNFTTSADAVHQLHLWTLVTSGLSHVGAAHLLFNLLALSVFGRDVERLLGSRGYLHLYVAGAIAASAGHVLYNVIVGVDVPALGASGPAMAVAVVSALLYPHRILLVLFILPMPAAWAMSLFVLIDVVGLFSSGADRIAHAAHLGGAAYGLLYWRFEARTYLQERLRELGVIPPRS